MAADLPGPRGVAHRERVGAGLVDQGGAGQPWRPSATSSTSLAQNAGRSSGFRLVTSPPSTTASWSTHSPPALRMSVFRVG